jgi:hypothetical protein
MQDLPEVSARIAAELATALLERDVSDPGIPIRTASRIDPEAYEQYLRGRFLEQRFDEESLRIADSAYRKALA